MNDFGGVLSLKKLLLKLLRIKKLFWKIFERSVKINLALEQKSFWKGGEEMRRVKNDKLLKKHHDEAVKRIAERPESSGIKGLTLEKLLHKPIEFPELKRKRQETGDLLFIWSPFPKEWEISVVEVTTSLHRPWRRDRIKLEGTFRYLKNHWGEWFKSLGLNLPEGYTLWIRTISVSYAGRALWEQPYKEEIRRKIF